MTPGNSVIFDKKVIDAIAEAFSALPVRQGGLERLRKLIKEQTHDNPNS